AAGDRRRLEWYSRGSSRAACRAALIACSGGSMEHPGFFDRAGPFRLEAVAQKVGAEIGAGADPATLIRDVKPLADAGVGHISFLDNRKYLAQLGNTRASACLVAPAFVDRVPPGTAALVTASP